MDDETQKRIVKSSFLLYAKSKNSKNSKELNDKFHHYSTLLDNEHKKLVNTLIETATKFFTNFVDETLVKLNKMDEIEMMIEGVPLQMKVITFWTGNYGGLYDFYNSVKDVIDLHKIKEYEG